MRRRSRVVRVRGSAPLRLPPRLGPPKPISQEWCSACCAEQSRVFFQNPLFVLNVKRYRRPLHSRLEVIAALGHVMPCGQLHAASKKPRADAAPLLWQHVCCRLHARNCHAPRPQNPHSPSWTSRLCRCRWCQPVLQSVPLPHPHTRGDAKESPMPLLRASSCKGSVLRIITERRFWAQPSVPSK